jgi:hypothetical protein
MPTFFLSISFPHSSANIFNRPGQWLFFLFEPLVRTRNGNGVGAKMARESDDDRGGDCDLIAIAM